MDAAGQFAPIIEEISSPAAGLKFTYGVPTPVELNYQTPPPAGFRTGRCEYKIHKQSVVACMAILTDCFDTLCLQISTVRMRETWQEHKQSHRLLVQKRLS